MELYVWKLSNPRDKRELEVQLKSNLLSESGEGPVEERDFDIAHYERVRTGRGGVRAVGH